MKYAVKDLIYLHAANGNWAVVSALLSNYQRYVSPALKLDDDLRKGIGVDPAILALFEGPDGPSTPDRLKSAWVGHVSAVVAGRRNSNDAFLQFRNRELDGGLLREGRLTRPATLWGGAGDSFAYHPIIKPILEIARANIQKQKLWPGW